MKLWRVLLSEGSYGDLCDSLQAGQGRMALVLDDPEPELRGDLFFNAECWDVAELAPASELMLAAPRPTCSMGVQVLP